MTMEFCLRFCFGSKYFAVQDGTNCFCGNSYGAYGSIPESFCNYQCSGNSYELCGGVWANGIYKNYY